MTDQKVLIFGSFTEEEIQSLQSLPRKNDVELKFGSLDSATLRSVGIFRSKSADLDVGFQPSKLVNRASATKICNSKKESQLLVTTVEGNGHLNGTHPSHLRDPSAKELKPSNADLPAHFRFQSISNSTNYSILTNQAIADVNESSTSLDGVASVNSSESADRENSRKSVFKASNGPDAALRSLLPRGLVNLGNLCFLNATIQALLSCSPFVELLHELRTRHVPKIGYPTLSAFVEFISDFDISPDPSSKRKEVTVVETRQPFRPVMFEAILKTFTPDVPNSLAGRPRQEDAQEFLSFLMHQMHDELLKLDGQIPSGNGGNSPFVSSSNLEDIDDDENWETVGPKNKSAVTRTQSFLPSKLSAIFGGRLRSVVKARGNKASATIQPYLLLHLNICPEPVSTIEDALRLFSAPETLEGYRSSAAGKVEVVSASKSVKILEQSEVMVLHLMRFSYGSQGCTKLHKPVHFPLELVLGRELLVSPSSEGRRYELVATITHHGRDPSKGHYTADARHWSGKWLRYDDASVTPISTSNVLHDQTYVLFYKQL